MKYLHYLLLLLSLQNLTAQEWNKTLEKKKIVFQYETTNEGINENTTHDILQDKMGFMWFGTPNGLYKFDGFKYTVYQTEQGNKNSLSENNVIALYEDSKGLLWIGTDDGVNVLDKETDTFYNYFNSYTDNQKSNKTIKINHISEDRNQNIWLATNVGIFMVKRNAKNPFSFIFEFVANDTDQILKAYHIQQSNQEDALLIGTNQGLKKIDIHPFTKKPYLRSTNILPKHFIYDMHQKKNGEVWLGTSSGIYSLNLYKITSGKTLKKKFEKKITGAINSISNDENGNLWIGGNKDGIYYIENNKVVQHFDAQKKFEQHNLKSNSILKIYADHSGLIWVGSSRGGLATYDLQKKEFKTFKNDKSNKRSLGGNYINALLEEDNQELWIGTYQNGLNKMTFNENREVFEKIKLGSSFDEKVFSLCKDDFGYLWVATQRSGLYRLKLNAKNNVIEQTHYTIKNTGGNLPTNTVFKMYKDKKGTIWMCSFSNYGLMRFQPEKNSTKLPLIESYTTKTKNTVQLNTNKVVTILEDREGILWLGTRNGLNKVYRNSENKPVKIIAYTNDRNDPNSLPNNGVFDIRQTKNGTMWIATFGGGISKVLQNELNKDEIQFKTFTKKDGLSDNAVYSILEDQNEFLWMSTNNGLSKFDPKKEIFKNYTKKEGLQHKNFRKYSFHKGKSGLFYFGGIEGFNVFNPLKIKKHTNLPKTVITDFKIYNKSVKINDSVIHKNILNKKIFYTKSIELNYDHKEFSFEFASLHYAAPKNNKYAYKLEGYDKDWIYTDSDKRFASYSNLTNGDYIFKVKSANLDNVWNEKTTDIAIKILPPFWKTWWMYIIYILVVIGLLFLFRYLILVREKYNTELKLEKFEREKMEEVNDLKLQFFTNISHEFKTPLTLILGPLEKLIESDKTDSTLKDMLVLMQRNANQLHKLIQQVLEFRKVENNEIELSVTQTDIVKYSKDIFNSFIVLGEKKGIELVFKTTEETIVDWFDIDKVEKIINNLLSNALKFTQKGGKISLSISIDTPEKETNAKFVEITVKDNGLGVPKSKIPFIFNRFYQVKTNENSTVGSGVGLALTKSLVKLHFGEISVKSKEKNGSKFKVRLPLGKTYLNKEGVQANYFEEAELLEQEQIILPSEKEDSEQNPKTEKLPLLLIVEDMEDMRTFIKSLLEEEYQILEATNGVEGKKIALEQIPDLIISDVMMPEMDGITLCSELKTNEKTSHIPLVLLTAKSSIESRIKGIETGADSYIPKPFHGNLLKAKLTNLLDTRKLLKEKYKNTDTELASNNDSLNLYDKAFLEKVENIIENNLMKTDFSVVDLGNELAYSRMQLYRKLKSITELSANEFIRSYRLKKAAELLKTSDMNITEILYEVGFGNRSYFTKCFKLEFEKTPKEYREDYRNSKKK